MKTRSRPKVARKRTKAKSNNSGKKTKHMLEERNRRTKLKKNPTKYAQYLKNERERKKLANAKKGPLTEREVRQRRKDNKERVRLHRQRQKEKQLQEAARLASAQEPERIITQSDPAPPEIATPQEPDPTNLSRQKRVALERQKQNLKAAKEENAGLKLEILKLKRKIWREEKSRFRKGKPKVLSPRSQVSQITQGKKYPKRITKAIFKSCALEAQLKESLKSLTSRKERAVLGKFLSGKILKSCRILNSLKEALPLHQMRSAGRQQKKPKCLATQERVKNFLESNLASTECPGKKQGRMYNGVQKQRRYMKADLKSLYQQFLSTEKSYLSYRTFCRYKPPHIVIPKLSSRDTCLCKPCENMKLLVKSCKSNGLLSSDDPKLLTTALCCADSTINCLLRKCNSCRSKTLIEFIPVENGNKPAMYRQWTSAKEKVYSYKAQKEIEIKVMKKNCYYTTIQEIKVLLQNMLLNYMQHLGRFLNQHKAEQELIKSLSESEMAFLIDWSMNYCCKYGREPQSVHFGASHQQIGLHTGRMYTAGIAQSFCSLSELTRHDPRAIIAHMLPFLQKYLSAHPNVTKLYFLSDGPTTQYRNRDLYWLVAAHLTKIFPNIVKIEWHFSEAGHGKGEADGVGGVLKRTADRVVAYGNDVNNLEKLVDVLSSRCPAVDLKVITLNDILQIDNLVIPKTSAVNGTMKMHHYIWTREKPEHIIFRTLSCRACPRESVCPHNILGKKPWVLPQPPPPPPPPPPPARPARSSAKSKRAKRKR